MIGRNNFYFQCLALLGFAFLSSCDSREDYFSEFGEPPTISVGKAEGDTTIYTEDSKFRNVLLHFGEKKTIDITWDDYYGCDFSYVLEATIPSLTYKNLNNSIAYDGYYFNCPQILEYDRQKFDIQKDFKNLEIKIEQEKKIDEKTQIVLSFEELSKNGIVDFLNGDTTKSWSWMKTSGLYQVNLKLTATNTFGSESYFNFFVQIYPNNQPVADFIFHKLDGNNMDYSISAFGTDLDGDDIVMYEYLFDGKIKEHENKIKYYSVYQNSQSVWEMSNNKDFYIEETALSGELIAPTKLSEIKHSFNKAGNHNVAVRCLDSKGCWSEWVNKTIENK